MRIVLVMLALVVAGCASPAAPEGPSGLAALGDSITRATNADGLGDGVEHSWATGTAEGDGVRSLVERFARDDRPLSRGAWNLAENGARVRDLPGQVRAAVEHRPDLVVILIGANDACRDTVDQMTSFATFQSAFEDAATTLRAALPSARVVVLSVPDVSRLVELLGDDEDARAKWATFGICEAALGPEGDPAAVRERIVAYNAVLARASERHGFVWDGGATFASPITRSWVSQVDAFHPSLLGQAVLADGAWPLVSAS